MTELQTTREVYLLPDRMTGTDRLSYPLRHIGTVHAWLFTSLYRFSDIDEQSKGGVFNLLSSRANLHISYNPVSLSHYRLQNHRVYIKHHHRGMGDSPVDVGEVPMT